MFGANANAKDENGVMPLRFALTEGHAEIAKLLLAELEEDSNVHNNDGWTTLHFAASRGYVEIVKMLMTEFGADVNVKNKNERHLCIWR